MCAFLCIALTVLAKNSAKRSAKHELRLDKGQHVQFDVFMHIR